jgi:hypothetical protein
MLSQLESTYCVDTGSVFAAGFSWGCDQVTALSCCRGQHIRAIAASSCSDDFTNPALATTYVNLPCPASGHTAIRFTFDPDGDTSYTAQEFSTTSALYQSFNACSSSSAATPPAPCSSFQSCKNALIECPYPGMGHALPANWPADTWSFLSGYITTPAASVPAVGGRVVWLGIALLGVTVLRLRSRRVST